MLPPDHREAACVGIYLKYRNYAWSPGQTSPSIAVEFAKNAR